MSTCDFARTQNKFDVIKKSVPLSSALLFILFFGGLVLSSGSRTVLNNTQNNFKTVSLYKTWILMVRYSISLPVDATIMISKKWPITGEHVLVIFVEQ